MKVSASFLDDFNCKFYVTLNKLIIKIITITMIITTIITVFSKKKTVAVKVDYKKISQKALP